MIFNLLFLKKYGLADKIYNRGGIFGGGGDFLAGILWIDIGRTEVANNRHCSQIGLPPLLLHGLGRRFMGYFHRRHHHVQVLSLFFRICA